MAAPTKDIVSMMDTQKHSSVQPDPKLSIPSDVDIVFANKMMHELLGGPVKTSDQEIKDAEFADKMVDELRLTPLES